MTIFESRVLINKPAEVLYDFLSDLNKHKLLMPDEIEDWVSTTDTAGFNIKNMAKINLEVSSRTSNLEIVIEAVDKPPFYLQFKWNLAADGPRTTVVHTITAELNMMMKMLASKPLQKLADTETARLANLFA